MSQFYRFTTTFGKAAPGSISTNYHGGPASLDPGDEHLSSLTTTFAQLGRQRIIVRVYGRERYAPQRHNAPLPDPFGRAELHHQRRGHEDAAAGGEQVIETCTDAGHHSRSRMGRVEPTMTAATTSFYSHSAKNEGRTSFFIVGSREQVKTRPWTSFSPREKRLRPYGRQRCAGIMLFALNNDVNHVFIRQTQKQLLDLS
ncbi:unnamed protein product [Heligmosomoides polygyrus]|uniref:Gamma-glutamylcyclotransferase n=1 Tax=Heligmosomoides polygyrus TaxID=6339 RepID=A0A183FWT3_HELPZ|nr:unnamed protein product [Heligmosomoides polygyrus]